MEPIYKVEKDEQDPAKFRVAHAGSEYTVQFKGEYQHGLTKRAANKMVQLLEQRRKDRIDRLSTALVEYFSQDPQEPTDQFRLISHLSVKHKIAKKSIETAIQIQIGAINA